MGRRDPKPEIKPALSRGALLGTRFLLLGALGIDGYLLWVAATQGAVAGCGPDSNCHTVLSSRWAYWFGIPVSAPALLVYSAVLAGTFFLETAAPAREQRLAWKVIFPCSLAILAAAGWFILLQVMVLHAICPYCCAAHTMASLAAAFLVWKTPLRNAPAGRRELDRRVFLSPRNAGGLALGAAVGLGVLMAGPFLREPTGSISEPIAAGLATNSVVATAREFELLDGKFKFNLGEVPLWGRPDAPHVMVSLFDYTCHHCRAMHGSILGAFDRFSNQLAVISLPMPLDGKCNPLMRFTPPSQTNACELARIGLTVWRADRKALPRFDAWMFAPPNPPLPKDAETYARGLVGSADFDRAAQDSWVSEQLKQDIGLYEAVYRTYRKGVLPELIIGTNLTSGTFSPVQLYRALSNQFGLKSE